MGAVLRCRSRARAGRPRAAAARPPRVAAARSTSTATCWVNVGSGRRPARRRTSARRSCARRRSTTCPSSTPAAGSSSCRSACSAPKPRPTRGSRRSRMRGVAATRVEPRQQTVAQTMLVVRDPPQPAVVRMKELQPQYPGSDLRVGARARRRDPRRARAPTRSRPRARCSRNTRHGSTSISASRISPASSRDCPATTRRRAAACCSQHSATTLPVASRCGRSQRNADAIGEVKRLYVRPRRAAPVPDDDWPKR